MAKKFGRYELVRELGRGGQAVVYEAHDPELRRSVALKVLLPGTRSLNSAQRFVREARAAAKLKHANIISIYDVGEWQSRHYMAMEIVDGGSLTDLMASRRLKAREALEIVERVADAVQCAHEAGIIHRDIKSANILIDAEGLPKLTDFGLALDAEAQTQLTQSGTIVGTAAYMPPEQAMGHAHAVDVRSDVYSLGAVLYEALTGRLPFEAETSLMLLKQIVYEQTRRPSEFRGAIPRDVETICLKCLEKDPKRRYQTAGELAEDCRRFLAGEPIAARPASVLYLARKGLVRHKALALGTVSVILALLIGLAVAVQQWRGANAALVRARLERERAQTEEAKAREAEAQAKTALAQAEAERQKALEEKSRAEAAELRLKEAMARVEEILNEKGGLEEALSKAREALGKEQTVRTFEKVREKGRREDAEEPSLETEATKKRLAEVLSEFDTLVLKGQYVEARRRVEKVAGEKSLRTAADKLWAAARVARALDELPAAVRRGAELLVGKDVRLKTKTGSVSGKLREVTDANLVVVTTYMIDRQRREKPVKLALPSLHVDQADRLARAGGWKVVAADRAIARAYTALSAEEFDGVEEALKGTGRNALADHLLQRAQKARAQAAYEDAIERARLLATRRNWKAAAAACEEALSHKSNDSEATKLLAEATKLLAKAERHIGPAPELTLDLGPRPDGRPGKVTMEFVYIKPGVFTMGGTEDITPDHPLLGIEKPKHEVAITRGFYIGRYEVTRGQFAAFVKATRHTTDAEREGSSWGRHPGGEWGVVQGATWRNPVCFTQADDHPVVYVSWNDVKAFCRWLAAKSRRQVRLPTEAEWECACRAGSTTRFCFGDKEGTLGKLAWHDANSGEQTHPVGQKKPNAWGLHDMHGNIWEWVADRYDAGYYANSPRENPTGPANGRTRVLRGGSWSNSECRSAIRSHKGPLDRTPYRGFRAAVTASLPRR